MKEVKNNQSGSKSFYLTIVQHLARGTRPSKICLEEGISKQKLNYYLSTLKESGFIRKIGYGTWEVVKEFDLKEVKKSVVIGKNSGDLNSIRQDSVRGHAFLFKLRLPSLRNWDKREEIFTKLGLEFKDYKVGGIKRGQQLKVKDRTVQLTDKSIIIQLPESFIADTAKESQSRAVYELTKLVGHLESILGASFRRNGQYQFQVSRQHYALVKNALAKQYDEEGKKLEVYTAEGLWFVIDNSFNLHEAETLHPKTAVNDNKKVQDFFNGIKALEGFTPEFINNSLNQNNKNMNQVLNNLDNLTKAVQELTQEIRTSRIQEKKKDG